MNSEKNQTAIEIETVCRLSYFDRPRLPFRRLITSKIFWWLAINTLDAPMRRGRFIKRKERRQRKKVCHLFQVSAIFLSETACSLVWMCWTIIFIRQIKNFTETKISFALLKKLLKNKTDGSASFSESFWFNCYSSVRTETNDLVVVYQIIRV